MKNLLNEAIVYLAGPIECVKDFGVGWRDDFIMKSDHLNLDIINPCNKPSNCTAEVGRSGERTVDRLRRQRKWSELQRFVKGFRREDLRFTDLADFLILYINPSIHMCGSYDEAFNAERQKKPLFAICEGGIEKLPTWLFGVFSTNEVFDNVDQCIAHLEKLNDGRIELDDRWVLIRKYLAEM